MAKGHIEIHDPISSHKDLEGSTEGGDAASPSDADNMEDTVEFRVMMAFAQRRRPRKNPQTPKEDQIQDQVQVQDPVVTNGHTDSNGMSSPQTTPAQTGTDVTEEKTMMMKKKKQKKKVWKHLRSLLCVKPETQDEGEPQKKSPEMPQNLRCGHFGDGARRDSAGDKPEEEGEFSDVAKQLTKLAAEIPFTPPELETDAPGDENVERMIGLLLRESGDQLNERELKDMALAKELFWNYSFFRTLMSALLTRMGLRSPNPESPGPHASPKTQIAVTCEATSRLSALSPLPANRLLGHGARYLNEYFSSWVQEQGGYDAAFEDDEDEDEDEVQ